eukprot:m.85837 g.85837  ORF g.85837 m.85837 type:complete len:196 (-) comp19804_c0_seq1:1040-1627(-)
MALVVYVAVGLHSFHRVNSDHNGYMLERYFLGELRRCEQLHGPSGVVETPFKHQWVLRRSWHGRVNVVLCRSQSAVNPGGSIVRGLTTASRMLQVSASYTTQALSFPAPVVSSMTTTSEYPPGSETSSFVGQVLPSSTDSRSVMLTRAAVVAALVKSSALAAGHAAIPPLQPGSGSSGTGANPWNDMPSSVEYDV